MCNHVLSTCWPPNRKHFCAYTCMYLYLVKFSSQSHVYRLMRRPSTAHQSPSAISHISPPNATDSSKHAVARFTSIALNVLPWTERHSAEPAPSVCLQNFTSFATCLRLSLRHSHTSLSLLSFHHLDQSIPGVRVCLLIFHEQLNPRMLWTSPTHQIAATDTNGS
jgi:hypothetical protein